mgnify:FL=1
MENKYSMSGNSKMIRTVMLVLVGAVLIFGSLRFNIFFGQGAALTVVSDAISTSGLASFVDHIIKFTVNNAMPANGKISVIFESGKFEIPTSFDYRDLDLSVDGVPQSLGSAASGAVIGAGVISGTSGSITFTLGSSTIASGSVVVIKAGRNASYEHSGLYRIKNPLLSGSYLITVKTYDASVNLLDQASTRIMVLESVRVTAARPSPPAPTVPPSPGAVGGGGGGAAYLPPENRVNFCGRAYPGSTVYLLKDGTLLATVQADPQANFDITAKGFSRGNYNFGLYTKDKAGRPSIIETYPVFLSEGVEIRICSLFFAPTIDLNNSEIRRGEILTIFGQSAPSIEVSVFVNSENDLIRKANSDKEGAWLYNLDTGLIEFGEHTARARARKENEYSNFSEAVSFVVGKVSKKREEVSCLKYDLNCDGRINLVDFSILAYWWKRPLTAEAKRRVDFNGDGKTGLVEFSILAYYWTG